MMRVVWWIAYVLFLVTALGCAHVKAVEIACKSVLADVDTALIDLQSDGWQAALDQLAIDKTLCIARAAVQEVVAALSGKPQLAMPVDAPASAEVVARGNQWLAAHK